MDELSRKERLAIAEDTLGVRFRDPTLGIRALTHPSYAAEHPGVDSYERLEFLGDAVLGLVVAEYLYTTYADLPEGVLTKARISLVSGPTLAEVAAEAGLDRAIIVGKGAAKTGGNRRPSVLEDCLEALIGALYVDQGLDACREAALGLLGERLAPDGIADLGDPKSELQELTQSRGGVLPDYEVIAVDGPAHERTFTVRVSIEERVIAVGRGSSKKEAEKTAARAALAFLEGDDPRP